MKAFLVIIFFSFSYAFASDQCAERLIVTDEFGKEVILCQYQGLMITESCSMNKNDCQLVVDWEKQKSSNQKALLQATIRNPGSWVCNQIGWNVVMAKSFDGSDLCLCEHPSKERIICTSLL